MRRRVSRGERNLVSLDFFNFNFWVRKRDGHHGAGEGVAASRVDGGGQEGWWVWRGLGAGAAASQWMGKMPRHEGRWGNQLLE